MAVSRLPQCFCIAAGRRRGNSATGQREALSTSPRRPCQASVTTSLLFFSGHSARKKERTHGEALTRRWCIVGRRGAPSSSLGFSHPGRPKGTLPTLRDVGASAGPAAGGGSLDPDPHHVKHSQRYFFGAAPGGGENAKSAEDLDPPRFRAPPVMVGPRAAPGSRGHWRSTTSRP